MNRRNKHRQQGFTLIEMIMVITLSALITVAAVLPLRFGLSSYLDSKQIASLGMKTWLGVERLSRELRMAGEFITILSTQLVFVNYLGEQITYQLSGNTLQRTQDGQSAQPLLDGVQSLAFIYQDSAGAVTSDVTQVHSVRADITVNSDTKTFTIRTTIQPRALS